MANEEHTKLETEMSIPSPSQVLEYFEEACFELGLSRTALGQESVGYSKLHKNLSDGCDIRLSTLRGLVNFVNARKTPAKCVMQGH
ncbi:hypothetical protein [Pseudovibrio sp. Tun.PSC04-5.I4]|uniref:hypothetical protein n=1 Tax=Pseudovibrio sp. Tun.PSC04-5.I4 TaxID=1798213 RepID=UPI00088329F8|nr:hypothetical protein [Pseudovibrio sp. Tun.PSC04-5.I4]SDR20158.1 hypothetical protein SAMN04515695_3366 [Pseudovibrio sp. Tun.PSC04-5.I4]